MRELLYKYKELARYVIVGICTTFVSLGTYFLCVGTFLNPDVAAQLQLANIISWTAAVLFAYVTNRLYVFESRNKNILREMLLFFAARVGSLIIDMGIMYLAVTVLGQDDKLVKLAVQVVVMAANYVLSKLVVFRK